MPLKNWWSIHARCSKSSLKHSIRFWGIFPSLKENFTAYRSSKVSSRPDCIFEIHQLWQWGFSRVYSSCYCSCLFEPEIIKIGQSFHKMYSNNVVNFQESTSILNACQKCLETYWRLHVCWVFLYRRQLFVSASHLAGLDTRSNDPKWGLGKGKFGLSAMWDDGPSWTWTQTWIQALIPDYSLNWTARSSAIQRWEKCQWCSSPTRKWPSRSRGLFSLKSPFPGQCPVRHECQIARLKRRPGAKPTAN